MAIIANAVVVLSQGKIESEKPAAAKPAPVITPTVRSITANNFVVLNAAKLDQNKPANRASKPKPVPIERKVEATKVKEQDSEPKGLFAHKPSQFLNDMLKEQN